MNYIIIIGSDFLFLIRLLVLVKVLTVGQSSDRPDRLQMQMQMQMQIQLL